MLSNVLKEIPKSYIFFEPLNLSHVPEAKLAGFTWRTYIPPDMEWLEGKTFLKRVIEGRVINEWTIKDMRLRESINVNKLIIKSVRANRLLPWICENLNILKPIILLRHPCAVIASQLKSSFDWNNPKQPDTPSFIEDLPLFKSALKNTKTIEEYLAASWALDQIPALMLTKSEDILVITYEELVLNPKGTLLKLFNAWRLEVDIDDAVSRLKKPSSVVYKSGISGIDGWKDQLTDIQTERILNVVNGMGLHFYNHELEANYDELYNDDLSNQFKKAGIID